ncbi:MAG: Flp pilus assembly protein CpaB [Candidatus Gastranaerophilales bacterium]|nr:Flp pilus assembly protein CpaB [Candidatus Gastranaerophilales bacterium]
MRHKQNKKKLFIAVILAIAAGLTVFSSMNNQKLTINTLSQQLQEQQKTIKQLKDTSTDIGKSILGLKVTVAKIDIKAGTKLTADMLELKEHPSDKITDDNIKDLSLLIGQVVSEDINTGIPVTKSKTLGLRYINLDIPPGMRAITIPVGYIQGLASNITVGSKIDVISVKKNDTPEFLLQGVKIISLEGPNVTGNEAPSSKADAITLLVPASSVPRLVDTMNSGKLQFVARGFSDNHIIKNYSRINYSGNNSSSHKFTLPPPPNSIKLTGINDIRQNSGSMMPIYQKVEVIQANVKSEVSFNNEL